MARKTRIKYTQELRSEIWYRHKKGESLNSIAREFETQSSSIYLQLVHTGGIRPPERTRSKYALSLSEHEEISSGLFAKQSIRSIASRLERSPSTISREINSNGGYDAYRAAQADENAWDRARRPKHCKLAANHALSQIVEIKLRSNWSPEQIAGWLKWEFPDDEKNQMSHETICRSLFVLARGALKKELQQYLRSKRTIRRAKSSSLKGDSLGRVANAVPISERTASVEDRALPGHWEGGLIEDSKKSCIATLVERHSRFVMLVKLENKRTETVVSALIEQARQLPDELYKSLTWDRGSEMKGHQRFTLETDIQVYLCDPQSPWQRGSNENTNRLLRQYLPKGTDLSVHSQDGLNEIVRQLNERNRKTLDYETPAERFNQCVTTIH